MDKRHRVRGDETYCSNREALLYPVNVIIIIMEEKGEERNSKKRET